MAQTIKQWEDGGSLTATYEGSGDGSAIFTSDSNEGIDREMTVTFEGGGISVERTVTQEGLRQRFVTADGKIFCVANGGRFGVLKGGVTPPTPVETYTRLTYIECDGQQYINTGYIVQEDDVIEMDYISTSSTSDEKALFGSYDGNGSIWYLLYSNAAYIRYGSSTSVSVSNARQKYSVKLKKGSADIDGTSSTLSYEQMPSSPLYLFARNGNNSDVEMYGYCKSLGFRIIKSTGEVVMNLKPCKRDSDGAIGMLDLVTGVFFGNNGSGEPFVGGSEIKVQSGYELIDFVTFSKDKLFDLGKVKSTYELEVMFKRSESSSTPYLYGCITSPHTASVTAYLSSGGSWRFGTSYKGISMNNILTHIVKIKNGSITYDFTTSSFTKATFTTPDTVVLGGSRAASGATSKSYQGRVYYYKITEGDTAILDWQPCKRLNDGVEGFWDCVSQTFIEPM